MFYGLINTRGYHFSRNYHLQQKRVSLLKNEPQLLAKIYKMPSKPVFLGARLASVPAGTQDRSMSTEDGVDCVLQEFDDGTGEFCFGAALSVLTCLTVFPALQV